MCLQDKEASSSMNAALDLAEIHGLLRKAICLLKGCEIRLDNGEFTFAVTSVVPWFKVKPASDPSQEFCTPSAAFQTLHEEPQLVKLNVLRQLLSAFFAGQQSRSLLRLLILAGD